MALSSGATQKPDVTIPSEDPPAELVVEDLKVGDGDEAGAGQGVCINVEDPSRSRPY